MQQDESIALRKFAFEHRNKSQQEKLSEDGMEEDGGHVCHWTRFHPVIPKNMVYSQSELVCRVRCIGIYKSTEKAFKMCVYTFDLTDDQ